MTEQEKRVLEAAELWWGDHRPCNYSLEEHLANPTVNCSGLSAPALAKAVAALVRSRLDNFSPREDDVAASVCLEAARTITASSTKEG